MPDWFVLWFRSVGADMNSGLILYLEQLLEVAKADPSAGWCYPPYFSPIHGCLHTSRKR